MKPAWELKNIYVIVEGYKEPETTIDNRYASNFLQKARSNQTGKTTCKPDFY